MATGVLRRASEVYVALVAVLVLLLARSAHAGFWLGLERAGVDNARGRWRRRSPLVQRAVPPLLIAASVLLIAWVAGVPPDPSILFLLTISYVLYLLPGRVRRFALPLTAFALVVAYPYFVQQTNYQRFLFDLPVFNAFPAWTRWCRWSSSP